MTQSEGACIYNKTHVLPIFFKNDQMEERNLVITIVNFNDALQIKIRDPSEYCFNFTENIDLSAFDVMRVNQSLEINFYEFKSSLLEMLQQFQKKEMYLKCVASDAMCTLVFYGKSKIKLIVFLTVDLHLTNQKEIFSELITNLQEIQEHNNRLKKQLTQARKIVDEKEQERQNSRMAISQLENRYHSNLKQIEELLKMKFIETEAILTSKITETKQRVLKLLKEVELLKKESSSRSDSSMKLLKTMENLKLENVENTSLINQLKKENGALQTIKFSLDKNLVELRTALNERETMNAELRRKNDELCADLEKATIIIAQKKSTIDELSRDLVQANQMLVNFNNHYDTKAKQAEELEAALRAKDHVIDDQRLKHNELLREFEEYKIIYNGENQERLKHDLFVANNKISELEKTIRNTNKINILLTEKVNHQGNPFNK